MDEVIMEKQDSRLEKIQVINDTLDELGNLAGGSMVSPEEGGRREFFKNQFPKIEEAYNRLKGFGIHLGYIK
jgi:hypothetical protein